MGKVKNRWYPSFGGLLHHADPFHVEDVVADEVTTYCLNKRFEEGRCERKPDKAKLLFKEPMYYLDDDEFKERVGAYCAACCGDWNVIVDPASNRECFVWNRISRQKIQLPRLPIKFKNFLKCILTAPPTQKNSQVWFFIRNRPIVLWSIVSYKWRYRGYETCHDDVVSDAVSCNGKIYALTPRGKLLHEIVLTPESFRVLFSYEEDEIELPEKQHLVDSCGQLYLVQRFSVLVQKFSVHRLQVFRRDFSVLEWVQVQDLGGRVFFLSSNHSVSLDAQEYGMENNCIYCTDDNNLETLYVFNLGDNTMSTSQHGPNSGAAVWLSQEGRQMPVLRLADINPDKKRSEEVDIDGENGSLFNLLPLELVEKIGKSVGVGCGYTNFRLVCRRWRLAALPCRWVSSESCAATATTTGYPWFISNMYSKDTFSFYDPGENVTYHKKKNTQKEEEEEDCVAHFIKDGWVLYSQGKDSMFVSNLLTQKRIKLPDLELNSEHQCGMCFSGSPEDDDFVVISIARDYDEPEVSSTIAYLLPGRSYWCFNSRELVSSRANPVFLNERYFFLCQDTNSLVAISLEGNQPSWYLLQNTENLQLPSAAYQRYLLVSASNICPWAVFVCNSGEWVGVYKYISARMKWRKLKNLGGRSLFVSAKATLIVEEAEAEAVAGMKNKIFFPCFTINDKILPYSMETCRFEEESNFCHVLDKLDGAWFHHKLVPTFQPSPE